MYRASQLSRRRALRLTNGVGVHCARQFQCRAEPDEGIRGISPATVGNFSRTGSAGAFTRLPVNRCAGDHAVIQCDADNLCGIADVKLLADARMVVSDGLVR